jgi:hypothetical protein
LLAFRREERHTIRRVWVIKVKKTATIAFFCLSRFGVVSSKGTFRAIAQSLDDCTRHLHRNEAVEAVLTQNCRIISEFLEMLKIV